MAAGALGSVSAAACWWLTSRPTAPKFLPGNSLTGITHLQVVAHPDDDLYFFNPDLLYSLRSGNRIVTVCLTGGEADGINMPPSDKRSVAAKPSHRDYVAARYNGLRAAYAHQVTGNPASPWTRETLSLPDSVAEISRLKDTSQVELIFLNMWQEGGRSPGNTPARLRTLWTDDVIPQPTMIPTGSPVKRRYRYTRAGLINTLYHLLMAYEPSVIRTMDPDPDYQRHDGANPQFSDFGDFSDHIDHTPTALFTWAALHRWWEDGYGHKAIVEGYRGYFNRRWPPNLSKSAREEKLKYLVTYGGGRGEGCDDPVGCGDLKVGALKSLNGYGQGTNYRHAVSTTWMQAAANGTLNAFAVIGGNAMMWVEGQNGSGFSDGRSLGGGRLVPHLAVVRHTDGRLQLFGVRMTLAANPERQYRDLVTTVQDGPGGHFGRWEVLGNPHQKDPIKRRRIGMPVAVCDGDGNVMVFVRTYFGGISFRVHVDGRWLHWQNLGGIEIQDGLAAITNAHGFVEVFASAKNGIRRVYQTRLGGPFSVEDLKVAAPAGPLSVVPASDGRLLLFAREAGTADIVVYRQHPNGGWSTSPTRLMTNGGLGPIAVASHGAVIALAHRNDHGGVTAITRWGRELRPLQFATDGPECFHMPSIAFNRTGVPVVAGLSSGGHLQMWRFSEVSGSS